MAKNKMRPNILFVNLLSLPYGSVEESLRNKNLINQELVMPMGILYLSSYLRTHNDVGKIEMLDYPLHFKNLSKHSSVEDFIKEEAEIVNDMNFTPHIIAVSLMFSTSHRFFNLVLERLKIIWPDAITVVGGIHATNCPETLLGDKNLDYVVRGEGEIAFSQMVRQLANNQQVQVKGVYDKNNIKLSKFLFLAEQCENLDVLPFPDWSLLDMESYVNASGWGRRLGKESVSRRAATVLTTRGCPFRCIYCSAHTVHGRKVRYRSVKSVLKEMGVLYKKYGVTLFTPADDFITADRKRLLSLLKEIHNLNIPGIEMQLPNGLNVNTMDEEILDAIIANGTKVIILAVESGSQFVLKNIVKKNVDLEKARYIIQLCHEKGVTVRCNIIFGFPGETRQLMDEAVDFLRNFGADWYTFLIAAPLIGSEMYRQFLIKGYFKEDVYMWSSVGYNDRRFDTDEMPAQDLKEFVYRTNLDINFVNNINLRNGNYDLAISLFNNIVQAHPFHIFGLYGLYKAYKGKGSLEEAKKTMQTIHDQIKTDERAGELYKKYGNLISEPLLGLK